MVDVCALWGLAPRDNYIIHLRARACIAHARSSVSLHMMYVQNSVAPGSPSARPSGCSNTQFIGYRCIKVLKVGELTHNNCALCVGENFMTTPTLCQIVPIFARLSSRLLHRSFRRQLQLRKYYLSKVIESPVHVLSSCVCTIPFTATYQGHTDKSRALTR